MATALILYPPPQDRKKFEHHYRTKHFPLVKKIPGLQSVQISRQPPRSLEGGEPYYLAIELEFASLVEMEAAFQSPESQAASADLANFAPPGRIRYTYNRVPIRGGNKT
ncbi:uncharacterized protein (TIGR02118 family) [Rhodoligotrophos appendicifer]|uniref:EthD family reductase n=1 Tax=Rhodoligotrophos appendicifer TaxID=987056 RepID=UPI001186843A|nr:EthD family reductase [Rhodoligotrophos appendicifer]